MGRRPADGELTKVTMNFFTSDVVWLKRKLGWGWTEAVRDYLHDYVKDETSMEGQRNVE